MMVNVLCCLVMMSDIFNGSGCRKSICFIVTICMCACISAGFMAALYFYHLSVYDNTTDIRILGNTDYMTGVYVLMYSVLIYVVSTYYWSSDPDTYYEHDIMMEINVVDDDDP